MEAVTDKSVRYFLFIVSFVLSIRQAPETYRGVYFILASFTKSDVLGKFWQRILKP